jgi:hypothetical protein
MPKLELGHLKNGFVIRAYYVDGPIELVTENEVDAVKVAKSLFRDRTSSIYKVHVFDSNSNKIHEWK